MAKTAQRPLPRQQNSESGEGGGGSTRIEVETTRRLKLGEVVYEETVDGGKSTIVVSGENIPTREVSDEEIASIVRFFSSFQRRHSRAGSEAGTTDGRGEVRDASTDGRIKR